MHRVRHRDLLVTFLPDGRVLVRSGSTGIGLKGPPGLVAVLAACTRGATRAEVAGALGPTAGTLYDHLAEAGLLVEPGREDETPLIFGNYSGVEVHRRMLSDEERLARYQEALEAVVGEGDVVIDAGAGTGVLSAMAALAGAGRVYAVERTEFAHHVGRVAADSGVGDRVVVVQEDFARVRLPERARVMVTETFGAWAFGEGMMSEVAACARANLAPGGVVVPGAVSLWLAPLRQAPDMLLGPFRHRDDGVDLTSLRPEALERSSIQWVDTGLTGEPRLVTRVDMPCEGSFTGEVELEGPSEALVGWFDLHLAPGVDLPTGPSDPWTHWKQSVIPVELGPGTHRVRVEAGPAPEDRRLLLAHFTIDRAPPRPVRFR